jgi:hypothetical protein
MNTKRLIQPDSLFSNQGSITKNGPFPCQLGNQRNQIDDDDHGLLNGSILFEGPPITKMVSPPLPCIISISTWLFTNKKQNVSHHHQLQKKKWDWWIL